MQETSEENGENAHDFMYTGTYDLGADSDADQGESAAGAAAIEAPGAAGVSAAGSPPTFDSVARQAAPLRDQAGLQRVAIVLLLLVSAVGGGGLPVKLEYTRMHACKLHGVAS